MDQNEFRIALISFGNNSKEYSYLCEDESIHENDYVFVEGIDDPLIISKIIYVTADNSPYPIANMKSVLRKANISSEIEKVHQEESEEESSKNDEEGKELNEEKKNNDNALDYIKNYKGTMAYALVLKQFSYSDYHADCLMKVNDGSYSTSYSLIREVLLINHTDNIYNNVDVLISFSSDIFSIDKIHVNEVEAKAEYALKVPFLKVDKLKLKEIEEPEAASIKVELIDCESGTTLSSEEFSFIILPFSQPSYNVLKDPRLFAKYVTPLSNKVKQIALNAVKFNNEQPLVVYQNKGADRIDMLLKEAQSIFLAIHDYGIEYQNPPANGFAQQRIRMPDEVLIDRKGTCMDLSILYCACLEEVGFHTILFLIDGHAFAGFFLEEDIAFVNGLENRRGIVYNSALGGLNKIAIVECTRLTAESTVSFNDALKIGKDHLNAYQGRQFDAVDIYLSHSGIFSPISGDHSDIDLELICNPKKVESEEIDPVAERKYIDVLKDEDKDRFTFWERKLLDLNEKNPLVNLNLKTSNCLKLISNSNIYELLSNKDKIKAYCIEFTKNVSSASIENFFYKDNIKAKDILGDMFPDDMIAGLGFEKTLKKLIKQSNSAMDETGAATLYLCLGLLIYKRKKGMIGNAPFMVLPIKVTKDKMGDFYTIWYDYDDVMINQTFFEYYKQEHLDVDFSQLYHVTSEEGYMDVVNTFKANNTEDIQLNENSFFIANLTFSHYIMWQDVRKRKEELKKNKVIESIIENRNVLEDDITDLEAPIDELEKYNNFAAPLYYDSTQLKAILECGKGKSFILDGPPGTGKSQTIVNMIVNAFYHGKTVLFVAEKKAALDVVADRLRKLGDPNSDNNLGRFCLELHSNKANKADFFEKLKNSMELGVTKKPDEFEKNCSEIEEKKNKLIKIINKLHDGKYLYSLYDAIVRQGELSNYSTENEFDESFLKSLNKDKEEGIYRLIDDFISASHNIPNYNDNPLKIINKKDINFYDGDKTISDFTSIKEKLSSLIQSFDKINEQLSLNIEENFKNFELILNLLDICFNKEIYSNKIPEFLNFKDGNLITNIFKKSKRYNELVRDTKKIFNFDSILDVDAETAVKDIQSVSGFFARLMVKLRLKKVLKQCVLPDHKIDTKELKQYFTQIKEYQQLYKYLNAQNVIISKLIGCEYFDNVLKVDEIENKYENTNKFISLIKSISECDRLLENLTIFLNVYSTKNPSLNLIYTLAKSSKDEYLKVSNEIQTKYEILNNALKVKDFEYLVKFYDYASNKSHFSELIDICSMNRIKENIIKLGLNDIVNNIVEGKYNIDDFKEIFELTCINGFIKMYFKDDDINYFNSSSFNSEVEKYRDLIDEYNNLVIANVSAKLTKNLNHNNINYANSSPIGRLKKSIASNGRGVSIRKTLLEYDSIIKRYFPCFLMSPLSAAQYLAVDEKDGKFVSKFDLVIFDEASQIPTHEAIGPIARGTSLIVAGDPEQMPPSAYFQSGVELTDDDIQFEDAPSLLDECIAIELPRIRLAYHYRSKHESLISFSNHNFYKDNLYTFPSPNTANSLVEFDYVDTSNEKEGKITTAEINAICSKFKEIYTNEKTKFKSVGIIVFNLAQQEIVSDKLIEFIQNDKALREQVELAQEKTKEPWFVKPLENVQGDERDIIILSIGFKKNSAGRPFINGPIVRVGGERRLNVAVSRSKEKMIVISTIRYADFEEDKAINSSGRLMVKRFIKFAEDSEFKSSGKNGSCKGEISDFIKKDLEELGYEVVLNVGNSDFKVDLAIKQKGRDVYQLGVLIDSLSLGEDISCRDKFYVQNAVLNALKWKIISIYSIEYFKDPAATIKKIIDALDMPYVKEEHKIEAHIEQAEVKEFHYNSKNYNKMFVSRSCIYYDNDSGYSSNIKNFIHSVVNVESPVTFNTIKERVRENSNIQSMSSKAKSRLQYIVNTLGLKVTIDENQRVYWANGSDTNIQTFRINSERDLDDIPKEEIFSAMNQVINIQEELVVEDLYKLTLEALGYGQGVLSKKNYNRLEYVYNWALTNNKIVSK